MPMSDETQVADILFKILQSDVNFLRQSSGDDEKAYITAKLSASVLD